MSFLTSHSTPEKFQLQAAAASLGGEAEVTHRYVRRQPIELARNWLDALPDLVPTVGQNKRGRRRAETGMM